MNSITRAALSTMRERLGIWGMIKAGLSIKSRELFGHPFRSLSPPEDQKERESRVQLGPAVLLYQHLLHTHTPPLALEITSEVIESSGHAFLLSVIGSLDPEQLMTMNDTQREELLKPKLAKIPNVVFTLSFSAERESAEREVHFTVTDCSFVRLCHQLDVPELAPLFCAVDDHFFGGVLPDVKLSRETTIASGGATCPFVLTFDPKDPEREH